MAKATSTSTKTVKGGGTNSGSSGSVPCNLCKGTGRLPKGYNKRKNKK